MKKIRCFLAIKVELENLLSRKVWREEPLPQGGTVVDPFLAVMCGRLSVPTRALVQTVFHTFARLVQA